MDKIKTTITEWKQYCGENPPNIKDLDLSLDAAIDYLEPSAVRLIQAFHTNSPESETNSELARTLYKEFTLRFEGSVAYSLLEYLIRSVAGTYQDRFGDFEGGQYPRLISPDAILGNRTAFRNVLNFLSSSYFTDGDINTDNSVLMKTEVLQEDPIALLSKLETEIRKFLLRSKNHAALEAIAERLGDICEQLDRSDYKVPPLYFTFLAEIEENLNEGLAAVKSIKQNQK